MIPAIALTTLRLLGARLKPTRDIDRTRAKKRPIESKTIDVAAPKPEEASTKTPNIRASKPVATPKPRS